MLGGAGDTAIDIATQDAFVFPGRGDGTFAEPAWATPSSRNEQVTAGDYDGDGVPDLAVLNNRVLTIYLGKGGFVFTPRYNFPELVGPACWRRAEGAKGVGSSLWRLSARGVKQEHRKQPHQKAHLSGVVPMYHCHRLAPLEQLQQAPGSPVGSWRERRRRQGQS